MTYTLTLKEEVNLENGTHRTYYENCNYGVYIFKSVENSEDTIPLRLRVQSLNENIPEIFIRENNKNYLPSHAVLNASATGSVDVTACSTIVENMVIGLETLKQINLLISSLLIEREIEI